MPYCATIAALFKILSIGSEIVHYWLHDKLWLCMSCMQNVVFGFTLHNLRLKWDYMTMCWC